MWLHYGSITGVRSLKTLKYRLSISRLLKHIVQDLYLMWLSITDPNSCLSDAIDFSGVLGPNLYSGVGGFCIFFVLIECLQKGKFKDDAMMCSFHRVVLDRLSVHTM